jgi:hypothetical protein
MLAAKCHARPILKPGSLQDWQMAAVTRQQAPNAAAPQADDQQVQQSCRSKQQQVVMGGILLTAARPAQITTQPYGHVHAALESGPTSHHVAANKKECSKASSKSCIAHTHTT